jgi:preprotein translocase subunit SecA
MLLGQFSPEDNPDAVDALGRQAVTEIYRQLLLNITTELWVDYLTQMEGLRVSIGLEAYAQRDPLVQYKNKAFGLFQELLNDMRLAVVSRMFTFRPRETQLIQTNASRTGTPQPPLSESESEVELLEEPEEDIAEGDATDEDQTDEERVTAGGTHPLEKSGNASSAGSGRRKRRRKR